MRIDPVQHVFQRISIRRRVYSVPGPNSLWHHDGQHGRFSVSVQDYKSDPLIITNRAHMLGYHDSWFH